MAGVIRDDVSECLIHLTKGDVAEATASLVSIMNEKKLRGGTGFIKGKHKCVCFSEAPLSKIGMIIAGKHPEFKYRPYGLMFKKRWVYSKGGLPVIYQPEHHYDMLDAKKQHLHVTFDLGGSYDKDFTWEREWRVKTDELAFSPADVSIILPSRAVADGMRKLYRDMAKKAEDQGGDDPPEPDPWHYCVLEDLGVHVDPS